MNFSFQQQYSNSFRISALVLGLIITIWSAGCTSSKKTTSESVSTEKNATIHKPSVTAMESQQLAMYRSKLSDLYATQQNTIPPAFQNDRISDTGYNGNIGYRIQIISTSRKDTAEAILHRFNDWIFQQDNIAYKAHAYIIFKQPDYRVQVGDFLTQNNAARFARVLKQKKYPDAWIVRGKINPSNVPADSTIDKSMQ